MILYLAYVKECWKACKKHVWRLLLQEQRLLEQCLPYFWVFDTWNKLPFFLFFHFLLQSPINFFADTSTNKTLLGSTRWSWHAEKTGEFVTLCADSNQMSWIFINFYFSQKCIVKKPSFELWKAKLEVLSYSSSPF